ncbi:hypothetical protein EHS25_005929 [Saitozyma podzolica]|uniref:ML-like domain-containing protein n=1 Tax=Saitozyma podzolica TaxID=1890683 RepID=A0A427XTR7_9TREE|nr:hypothetical protein EHS25_005929 [Saitozyma podzolica]
MTLPGGNRNPPRARGKRGIGGSIGSAMGTTTRSGPGPTRLGLVAILVLSFCSTARAALLQPSYRSCLSSYSPIASGNGLLNITGVYAELVSAQEAAKIGLQQGTQGVLRVDLIGVTGEELVGYDNTTNKLATLFSTTTVGSISVYSSTSWLCNSVFPSNLTEPYYPFNTTYCPLPAGPFAINLTIPLYRSYGLTTLSTEVRIVDTSLSANTIACVDIDVTPYNRDGWYYELFLWLPVAIAVGFWATSWTARFTAGWIVGSGVAGYETKEGSATRIVAANKREARMRKWGTMIVSGLSGERLSVSGGLLRFVTPGLRDVMYHIQFCSILGMIAVNWPEFAYPIIARTAWADLVWNTTLVQGSASPVVAFPTNTTLPSDFAPMMTNSYYPLYLDSGAYNPVLDLHGASPGLASFATAVGLRPQDLFGTCLTIFLMLALGIIVLSVFLWTAHGVSEYLWSSDHVVRPGHKRHSYGSSPGASIGGNDISAASTPGLEIKVTPLPTVLDRPTGPSKLRRTWWRFRPKGEAGAFHAAALTLLALGTMYNVYVEDKQMFRVFPLCASLITGIVVGAGQASGIAQAVILVLVELVMLVVPAIWYPWGEGASMGAPHTFLGVIRVTSAVLVMILSPNLEMTSDASDWIAYAVLLLQAIAFIFFVLMLITKLVEGLIRLFGAVHFDESTHPLDGGLFAAIADLDCLNPLTGGKAAARKRRKRGSRQLQRNVSAAGSLTTQMMLDRHSQGVQRQASVAPTPFLTPYSHNSDSYFPGPYYSPPLGPPPFDRRSSDSRSDEPEHHNGNIMDAWRPPPSASGYVPPGVYAPAVGSPDREDANTPARSFSVVRGGRADLANPYAMAARSPPLSPVNPGAPLPPGGSAARPPPTIRVAGSPPGSGGPGAAHAGPSSPEASPSRGLRANTQGLVPPVLAIPTRRSLNDLKGSGGDSPSSQYSGSTEGKKKTRSRGIWFSSRTPGPAAGGESTEESDSDAERLRRKAKRRSGGGGGAGSRSRAGATSMLADDDEKDVAMDRDVESGRTKGRTMREPLPFEPVPPPGDVEDMDEDKPRGWRRTLGLTKKSGADPLGDAARDENKARKAALATESGALFAGVDAMPVDKKSFKVIRKGVTSGRDSGSSEATSPRDARGSTTSGRTAFDKDQSGDNPLEAAHDGCPGGAFAQQDLGCGSKYHPVDTGESQRSHKSRSDSRSPTRSELQGAPTERVLPSERVLASGLGLCIGPFLSEHEHGLARVGVDAAEWREESQFRIRRQSSGNYYDGYVWWTTALPGSGSNGLGVVAHLADLGRRGSDGVCERADE